MRAIEELQHRSADLQGVPFEMDGGYRESRTLVSRHYHAANQIIGNSGSQVGRSKRCAECEGVEVLTLRL